MRGLIIILIVIFLTGCSFKVSDNNNKNNEENGVSTITNQDTRNVEISEPKSEPMKIKNKINPQKSSELVKLFDVKRDELTSMLGDNYRIIKCGPDASYDGYYYDYTRLNAVFISEDYIDYFECYEIDGISIGMSFSETINAFGEKDVDEIYYPEEDGYPEMHEYELNYNVSGHLLRFISSDNKTIDEIVIYNDEYSNYYFENKK